MTHYRAQVVLDVSMRFDYICIVVLLRLPTSGGREKVLMVIVGG